MELVKLIKIIFELILQIIPRIHKATGKISNFAISFETILEILTFIINYANIHGLPSPDIYIIYFYFILKFCNITNLIIFNKG